MVTSSEKPTLFFTGKSAWSRWLASNHAKSSGVWLRFAKKASGVKSLTYAEALDSALCYGWIDGQAKSDGDDHYLQKFTPRGKRSIWSKRNRDKALALITSGRMRRSGLAEVERAKKDGRWEAAYDSPRNAIVPDDLQAALEENPTASEFFAALDKQNRYAVLFRVHTAKKPETRAKRIREFVAMLARNEKVH